MFFRICLPFRCTSDHPWFLVGFVLPCILCCNLNKLFVFWSLSLFATALSVYFRHISLIVPLESFAVSFTVYHIFWTRVCLRYPLIRSRISFLLKPAAETILKIQRYSVIANKTTALFQRQIDIKESDNRSPYDIQQSLILKPYSKL